jgi:hypothetical protein
MATVEIPAPASGGGGGGGGGIVATLDTYANILALTPSAGDIAYASDLPGLTLRCFSAGTWTKFLRDIELSPVPSAGWSWNNQTSGGATATVSTPGPFQSITTPGIASGNHIRHRFVAAPATPWKLTAMFDGFGGSRTIGLSLRESSSNKIYRFGISMPNVYFGASLYSETGAGPPLGTTSLGDRQNLLPESGPITYSIEDDGVDLIFRILMPYSGIEIEYFRHGRTTFMASGPDEFGFHIGTLEEDGHVDLLSWKVE